MENVRKLTISRKMTRQKEPDDSAEEGERS